MAIPKARLLFAALALCSISSALLTGCGAGSASTPPSQSPPSFQVIVTPPAPGTGTVSSSPPGIQCPTTCTASFSQGTQVKLTATPASNYSFKGWGGACSGTSTCRLMMRAKHSVTATFAASGSGAGSGAAVIAYIFTPDGLSLTTSEFALLSDGELRATKNMLQPWLMAGTAQGLVADLPGPNGDRWPTGNLQPYALEANGSLRPRGSPITFPVDKYASSLASDSTYVYAVSDEGIFGFEDTSAGLRPLPPIQESVPHPCTSAEENANQCLYSGSITLGKTSAFFAEVALWQSAAPSVQLSSFVRSQGQLTSERLLSPNPPFVQAIAGNFAYAIDNDSTGIFIELCAIATDFKCSPNVLSNGDALSDAFVQLVVTPSGSFLFAAVFDGAAAPRVRVFRINPSSGTLTEVPGSPFLTGQYYFQFATLDPSGRFLLVTSASCDGSGPCGTPGKLAAMRIDDATGELSVTSDVEDGQDPYTIVAAPISQ